MKEFDIWSEGYVATGQSSGATLLGYAKGEDFVQACVNLAKQDREFASYFDKDRMTYWGCRLFDNSSDARKSFG